MTNNLRSLTLIGVALFGFGLLALTATPSLANLDEEIKENYSSNFTHYGERSNQNYQMIAQDSPRGFPGCCGGGGWGYRSQYGRMYDPNSIETISGEVVSIDTFTPMGGMSQGMHLRLKTDSETVDVHLGPAWYLQNQDIQIQPSDQITVTGSRVNFSGQSAMMTSKVHKGDQTLTLRDENGFPVWHGWRQRQPN